VRLAARALEDTIAEALANRISTFLAKLGVK
jgi:hypothetical protein